MTKVQIFRMLCIIFILILIAAEVVQANTYTVQCIADAKVASGLPVSNFGSATTLSAGYDVATPSNGNWRTFLLFDLVNSNIPPQEVDYITDVWLKMNVTQSSTSQDFYVWNVGSSWNEAGITWNNQPGLGTYVEYALHWASTGYYQVWLSRNGNTWFKNWLRGSPNYGLEIRNGSEGSPSNPAVTWTSRENTNPNKPVLIVQTSVAPTPTITVITPNGGEQWKIGETRLIRWSSVNIGWTEKIQILYSPTVGGSEILIDEVTPNNTSYNWTIPSNAPTSNQYRILLRAIYHSTIYALDWSDGTFTVGAAPPPQPHISLSPNYLNFYAVQNGPLPQSQTFTITNTGSGTLDWSVSDGGIVWLDESPTSGTSNNQVITISINTTNLSPGTYPATITVNSSNADNQPQIVSVTYVVSPITHVVTIQSLNPASGVTINASPPDYYNQSSGSTQFSLTYVHNIQVTVSAPPTAQGNNFQRWERGDGYNYPNGQTSIVLSVDNNYTMIAVYIAPLPARTLTVTSTNPNSNVPIEVDRVDKNGNQNDNTPFIRYYDDGTVITLTAPPTTGGNVFLKWQKNGQDNVGTPRVGVLLNADLIMTAVYTSKVIVVKDADGHPIPNKTFTAYRVQNSPPTLTETEISDFMTDSQGRFTIPLVNISVNDWIKIAIRIHSESAKRHASNLGMFKIDLDNALFGTPGDVQYDVLNNNPEQTVVLGHTTFLFNLLVSLEWDADLLYQHYLMLGFRDFSNYLYDVSDGQVRLDTVMIYDDKSYWIDADMRILSNNFYRPDAGVGSIWNPLGGLLWYPITMPRKWYGNNENIAKNFSYKEQQEQGYINVDTMYDFKAKCHEFGHYALSFYDEYTNSDGEEFEKSKDNKRCQPNPEAQNYGFMDDAYNGEFGSEMSSSFNYTDVDCRNTQQYSIRHMPCWNYMEAQFQKSYSGIFAPIVRPDERNIPGYPYFLGPNNNLDNPDYNVGDLVVFPYNASQQAPTARTVTVSAYDDEWTPFPDADVYLIKGPGAEGVKIYQGQTVNYNSGGFEDYWGKIKVLGYNDNDYVETSGKKWKIQGNLVTNLTYCEKWFVGQASLNTYDLNAVGNSFKSFPSGDSINISLRPIEGDYPLVFLLDFQNNSLTYSLDTLRHFQTNPVLVLQPDYGGDFSYLFNQSGPGYYTLVTDTLGFSGTFTLWALDDSALTFFVNSDYVVHYIEDSLSNKKIIGPHGHSEFILDSLNTSIEKTLVLASPYLVVKTGLEPLSREAGETQVLSVYPATELVGNNLVTIRYADSDVPDTIGSFPEDFYLRLYHWNETFHQWEEQMESHVDTSNNTVSANISETGVYGAFTRAMAKRGDANQDGIRSLVDVMYLVNHIFKSWPTPAPPCSGDVDGDLRITLSDVIYLVNAIFKGWTITPPEC